MSDFSVCSTIIPSGEFLGYADEYSHLNHATLSYVSTESPFASEPVEVCNPMASRSADMILLDEVSPHPNELAHEFDAALRREYKDSRLISQSDLDSYGEQLLAIHKHISRGNYDAVVVPLRGGLKPWIQLEVLGGMQTSPIWLPYTAGSQGRFDEQVRWHLESKLPADPGQHLHIAIIDTAIGGHSSFHLAEIASNLKRDKSDSKLFCDFHLLHDQERHPAHAMKIPTLTHDHFHPTTSFWGVQSLAVEDWNEAFGLQAVSPDGREFRIKHASTDGTLLFKENSGVIRVFKSDEMHHLVDHMLAASVSDAVLTDPHLQYQRDVWQRYVDR